MRRRKRRLAKRRRRITIRYHRRIALMKLVWQDYAVCRVNHGVPLADYFDCDC